MTSKIKSNPNAFEDFLMLVVESHILAIVMEEFHIESLDGTPHHPKFSKEEFLDKSSSGKREMFMEAVEEVIGKYMYLYNKDVPKESDSVKGYAKQVVSLGLLYMEYSDGIREGDGDRIIRCWRYMLLIFRATNKRKYSIQAATLLLQYHFVFTERMKEQLVWSRTINTHGRLGKNIPMDLHNEHLNRIVKDGMKALSSNVNEAQAIERIGKSLRLLVDFLNNFDTCADIPVLHGHHSSKILQKDLHLVLEELQKADVLNDKRRKHSQFPNCKESIFCKINQSDLEVWLMNQLSKLV